MADAFRDLRQEVRDGFQRISDKVENLRVDQAQTIYKLRDDLYERIAAELENHKDSCPIREVTEVGLKIDRRRPESYETPVKMRTVSTSPARLVRGVPKWAIGIGMGIVLAIVFVGIFIGAFSTTGSTTQATDTVRKIIAPAAAGPQATREAGASPAPGQPATGGPQ